MCTSYSQTNLTYPKTKGIRNEKKEKKTAKFVKGPQYQSYSRVQKDRNDYCIYVSYSEDRLYNS